MSAVGAVRQVALSAGRDLDVTLAFWRDVLGLDVHARYDPPGIAFIMAGPVRLLFTAGVPAGTVYLDIAGLEAFHAEAKASGVPFTAFALFLGVAMSITAFPVLARIVEERGLTIVPLSLYFKDGRAKVEIALARGKKTWDKRHALAERQAVREIEQAVGRRLKGMRD